MLFLTFSLLVLLQINNSCSRSHHFTSYVPFESNCTSYTYDDCPLGLGCEKVVRMSAGRELFRRCRFLSKAAPALRSSRPRWQARFWLSSAQAQDAFS